MSAAYEDYQYELIDELEAGELSVEFEGEEPQALLEWALERFSPRIALSTAFQVDGVALIDMAYEIDPTMKIFSVDTGRLPEETFELIERLEERFGADVAPLRLQLDGCPHACGQHWVADLGFQGTTARDEEGTRRQAYDIFLRGGLGPGAAIGRPLFRRILTEELDRAVEGLIQGWLDHRVEEETFTEFCRRSSDEELGNHAGVEPAKQREREEVAA